MESSLSPRPHGRGRRGPRRGAAGLSRGSARDITGAKRRR
jgi:hypothetical protein